MYPVNEQFHKLRVYGFFLPLLIDTVVFKKIHAKGYA